MLKATYLTKASIARAVLACALSFGLGSVAMAAESEASSMAESMPQSGATVYAASDAVENGLNQASGSSTSLSSTARSTAASAHDSEMMTAPPPVAVKNIFNDKPTAAPNPASPTSTVKAASNQNSLIENAVKQSTTTASVAASRIPHEKIQYWNLGKRSSTKQH